MRLRIERYAAENAEEWDSFVESSNEGTLSHRLDFLAYHGERFRDNEHHVAIYKGQSLYAVMPLAIFDEAEGRTAKSPYGASYGGPAFQRPLSYSESQSVAASICDYLQSLDVRRAVFTLPYSACYRRYCETFRLALLEHGFVCMNRDICNAVLLDGATIAETVTSRARNMVRKAKKSGVRMVANAPVPDFWRVLEKNYDKLGATPTHRLDEFCWLCENLPAFARTDVAYLDAIPIAGMGYLTLNARVDSAFYLCQDPAYQKLAALSWLISEALEASQAARYRWFDFGTSSAQMQGRPNLFKFKESFGALGFFRETYCWTASG